MAEVVKEGRSGYLVIEHNRPICEAAQACTGLCDGELEMFQRVLGDEVSIERTEHLIAGGDRCVYRITPAASGQGRSLLRPQAGLRTAVPCRTTGESPELTPTPKTAPD